MVSGQISKKMSHLSHIDTESRLYERKDCLHKYICQPLSAFVSVSQPRSLPGHVPYIIDRPSSSQPELARTFYRLTYFGSPCLQSRPLLFCLGYLKFVSARYVASRLGSPLPYLSNRKVSRTRLSRQAIRKPQLPHTYQFSFCLQRGSCASPVAEMKSALNRRYGKPKLDTFPVALKGTPRSCVGG